MDERIDDIVIGTIGIVVGLFGVVMILGEGQIAVYMRLETTHLSQDRVQPVERPLRDRHVAKAGRGKC